MPTKFEPDARTATWEAILAGVEAEAAKYPHYAATRHGDALRLARLKLIVSDLVRERDALRGDLEAAWRENERLVKRANNPVRVAMRQRSLA